MLAPVVRGRKGEYSALLDDLAKQGFARVRVDGEILELSDRTALELARYEQHTIEVVVDRLVRRDGIERRLTDSIETALRLGEGIAEILLVADAKSAGAKSSQPVRAKSTANGGDGAARARAAADMADDAAEDGIARRSPRSADGEQVLTFSQHLACVHCGISLDELAPRSFSFNSPYGACPACNGLGTRFEVDPELVVPNPDLSLSHGAIGPWAGARTEYFSRVLKAVAEAYGFSMDKPWSKLSKSAAQDLLFGAGTQARPRPVPQPLRHAAQLRHPVRGRHAVAPAAPLRGGLRLGARAGRGLHARGPVPDLRRDAASPGVARRQGRGQEHRRAVGAVHPGGSPAARQARADARARR